VIAYPRFGFAFTGGYPQIKPFGLADINSTQTTLTGKGSEKHLGTYRKIIPKTIIHYETKKKN
jgi:hypothetical protein